MNEAFRGEQLLNQTLPDSLGREVGFLLGGDPLILKLSLMMGLETEDSLRHQSLR